MMDGISFNFGAGIGGMDFDPIPPKKEVVVAAPIPIKPQPRFHPEDDYLANYANSPETIAKEEARIAAEKAWYAAHPEVKRQSPKTDCSPSLMDEVRAAFRLAFPN